MATIDDFSDILSAMEQNPELQEAMRNHVLGEELRQLPAVVHGQGELLVQALERLDELATTLRDVMEQISGYALVSSRVIATTVERQDRIETDVAELKASQARLEVSVEALRENQTRMEGDIAELKTGQTRMEGDIAELKTGQARMEGDIAELKAGQARMEGDIAELKTGQARMEGDISELKTGQTRMQGQLNNLTGTDYERKVAKRAPRATRRYLGLRGVNVVYGITVPDSIAVQALLEEATESLTITNEQADEVERAGLILRGMAAGNEEVYAIAEVSVTIGDSDIDRARNHASILEQASGMRAQAVVIGTAISDANQERASDGDVTVIIMGE